jgi:hypothetical protein
MNSRLLRCLILVGSFNLVLPPGWCCIFNASAASVENETAEPNATTATTCCCHCNLATKPQALCEHESPAPSPDPVPPGECPCTDRQTTLTHAFKISMADLCPTLVSVALYAVPCWTSSTGQFDVPSFHSAISLQIIYCAWLC